VHKYTTRPYAYNPASEREVHFYSSGVPRRDIAEGEELFDNYLAMTGLRKGFWATGEVNLKEHFWATDLVSLKEQCDGQGAGIVTEYENWEESCNDATLNEKG
jgi:hypothetical protein